MEDRMAIHGLLFFGDRICTTNSRPVVIEKDFQESSGLKQCTTIVHVSYSMSLATWHNLNTKTEAYYRICDK